VIHIVSDYRGTYHYVVDKLQEDGAELIELDPDRGLDRTISKLGILRQMVTPRLLRLRKRWTGDDVVLVISWYLIPVLLLVRLGLLRRPRRLVSMGAFVHDERVRGTVNLVLGVLKSDELEFIAFSEAERRNLCEVVGIRPKCVHRVVYRGNVLQPVVASPCDGDYIFTGGYSNRDYATFFDAVSPLEHSVVTVASTLNDLKEVPRNVDLRLDIPWEEFEDLVGGCALLVLPLQEGGEACGQNVLFRGIRHSRPVVATRHDSLIDYLGDDYPGFVPANDPEALRAAIERGLSDDGFRSSLLERVDATSRWFREQGQVEAEIAEILAT
jgi:glycosyltransferase involved in cell wall biosynthesis